MRWFWIDRYTEFVRCRRARAVKAVTLAEEHLHDHFPGAAMMPATLVLEGMAQTAGLLVADALDYRRQVVLAKVGGMRLAFEAVPGDTIEYLAEIVELSELGSVVKVTSRIGDREHGEADRGLERDGRHVRLGRQAAALISIETDTGETNSGRQDAPLIHTQRNRPAATAAVKPFR